MSDPLARRLAALALAMSLVASVLAGYAVHLGLRYLEDVRTLGDALGEAERRVPVEERDLAPPPPALAE